jgi:hypothetical protein
MKSAKQFLIVSAAFVLAVTTFTVVAPKSAHAIVATLVQVSNTSANPAITRDADNAAQHGFVLIGSGVMQSLETVGSASLLASNGDAFQVPAGKRFVVQNVSTMSSLTGDLGIVEAHLFTFVRQGDLIFNFLTPPAAGQYSVSQQLTAYSDAGYGLSVVFRRNAPSAYSDLQAQFTVTGYLVDCPGGAC